MICKKSAIGEDLKKNCRSESTMLETKFYDQFRTVPCGRETKISSGPLAAISATSTPKICEMWPKMEKTIQPAMKDVVLLTMQIITVSLNNVVLSLLYEENAMREPLWLKNNLCLEFLTRSLKSKENLKKFSGNFQSFLSQYQLKRKFE